MTVIFEVESNMLLDEIFVQGNEDFDSLYDHVVYNDGVLWCSGQTLSSGTLPPSKQPATPKVIEASDIDKALEALLESMSKEDPNDVHTTEDTGAVVAALEEQLWQGQAESNVDCKRAPLPDPNTRRDGVRTDHIDPYAQLKVKVRT